MTKKKQKKWTEDDVEAELHRIIRELELTPPKDMEIQITFMSPKKLAVIVGGRDAHAAVTTLENTIFLYLLTEVKKWPRKELRRTLGHEIGHVCQHHFFQERGRQKKINEFAEAAFNFHEYCADIFGGVPIDGDSQDFVVEEFLRQLDLLSEFQGVQLSRENTAAWYTPTAEEEAKWAQEVDADEARRGFYILTYSFDGGAHGVVGTYPSVDSAEEIGRRLTANVGRKKVRDLQLTFDVEELPVVPTVKQARQHIAEKYPYLLQKKPRR